MLTKLMTGVVAELVYSKNPNRFIDRVDGVGLISWEDAQVEGTQNYYEAVEKAKAIVTSDNPEVELIRFLGKDVLLHEFADFTWFWGIDWFVETRVGNFHWRDPSYGPEDAVNTLTYFNGDIAGFCKHLNIDSGREKGMAFVSAKCGEDFTLILPE